MTLQLRITGPLGSGKTCILQKVCNNPFIEKYIPTAGVDFNTKSVWYDGEATQLHLWGLSGDDKYLALTETYRDRVDGFILVFDVTDYDSFKQVPKFLASIKNLNVPILLVGNKIDDEDKIIVSNDEAEKFASDNRLPYIEASAKTGTNLQEILVSIIRLIMTEKNKNTYNSTYDKTYDKMYTDNVYDSDDLYDEFDDNNILMDDLKKKNRKDLKEPLLPGKSNKSNKSNKLNVTRIRNFFIKYVSCMNINPD